MREKAVTIGASNTMVGILTEPKGKVDYSDKPGIIILTSGILHRIGPCRLSTKLARSIAPHGYPVVRFDASGIGDSEPRKDSLAYEESGPIEVKEVMDFMTRTKKVKTFVLMGLCSGADMAFMTANVDERVIGTVQIDGYAYTTPRFKLNLFMEKMSRIPRLLVWENLSHSIRVRTKAGKEEQEVMPDEDYDMPSYVREFPPREFVADKLKALAARKMYFYYIYTGGEDLYNYRGQFEDAFADIDFNGRLHVDYLPETDHIVTNLDSQKKVVGDLSLWVAKNWGTIQSLEKVA